MRVQVLADTRINGNPVKAGAILNLGRRHAEKLIREGMVRALEEPQKKLETK